MNEGKELKWIQYCRMRWNSVLDMFARLLELRWPVVIVLSDRSLTNLSDAKALDMKEEHWMLMADLVPLLRPLHISQLRCYLQPSRRQHQQCFQPSGDLSTLIWLQKKKPLLL